MLTALCRVGWLVLVAACTSLPSAAEADPVQANLAAGRWMQALYHIEAHAAQNGWSAGQLELAGDLWQRVGDTDRARVYWENAVLLAVSPQLLTKLAQTYIDLALWAQAADRLDQLLALEPGNAWASFQLGLIRLAPNPPLAVQHLRQAAGRAEFREVSAQLLAAGQRTAYAAGIQLTELELWPYAELAFQYALDIGEAPVEALAYMGYVRDQQGKDGAAWMAEAVSRAPDNALVHYLAGLHWRLQQDTARSLESFIQATALEPENPAFYAELSTAYRLRSDLENAERWLRVAVALGGDDPRFQQMLALFYAEEAYRLEVDGLDTLESTTVLLPNDPEIRAGFGWALFTMGEVEAGLGQLDRALEIDPNNARALYYKARVLIDTEGDSEQAVRLLERATGVESSFREDALRLLNGLRAP